MPSRAECRCLYGAMTHEEADYRLAAGWHVDLEEADALCSAQRKRYLRSERERLSASAEILADLVISWTKARDSELSPTCK